MTTTTPDVGGGRTVAFVASDTLARAIDRVATRNRETRSDLIRRLVGDGLVSLGQLRPDAPRSNLDARRKRAETALRRAEAAR
ncbi:hypothetical protein [Methylobacterium aerolatum]|uniref:Ribbon-helix-helix protein CopG domain-containing protein n=1 Tax=Methylobacterium aerolatum TaxID=418708 RepID=A0ABU0I0D6_9HYPH|nr:hypothetical protein [Methylobacterium aerolatum]MDQ0448052.1 hypothetical protein [Methylobacterium aerolatum]GJD36477.1 hypothetical protein FMGBMHLM_3397 [Methylobacterium aerolatum]